MKKVWTIVVCAVSCLTIWAATPHAAGGDVSTLPLLQFSDLNYLGAFRLPDTTVNGYNFSYGGAPVAYNPANDSLFVGGNGGIAEISIPAPSPSTDINQLPFASLVQGFVDPTQGTLGQVGTGVTLNGLMVYGDRLYGTASIYYDANNIQRLSHYSRSTDLSASSFSGWSAVWHPDFSGFVSGFMGYRPVPARDGGAIRNAIGPQR